MSNINDSRKAHISPVSDEAGEEIETAPIPGHVPVDVENIVRVRSQKYADPSYDIYVSYTTYVIQPSAVMQILPQDELRLQAAVRVVNSNIVLCKQQDQAQAKGNLQGTTGITNFPPVPQGFLYSPGENPPALLNNETLWAVNCDPTLVAYVSVIIERGGAA